MQHLLLRIRTNQKIWFIRAKHYLKTFPENAYFLEQLKSQQSHCHKTSTVKDTVDMCRLAQGKKFQMKIYGWCSFVLNSSVIIFKGQLPVHMRIDAKHGNSSLEHGTAEVWQSNQWTWMFAQNEVSFNWSSQCGRGLRQSASIGACRYYLHFGVLK